MWIVTVAVVVAVIAVVIYATRGGAAMRYDSQAREAEENRRRTGR